MKVFALAPKENWICDRIVSEWYEYFGEHSTKNSLEADLIWLNAGWCWNHVPKNELLSKKVVCTEHHIVPEKFGQNSFNEFMYRDQFIDLYHVPNPHTREIVAQLTKKPIEILNYWYDSKKWFPEDRREAKASLDLPGESFIIGSFQRDSEGDTDKPKLEKGPDVFCDYVERLSKQKNVHVLLGGWRRKYVTKRLDSSNIKYTLKELASEETLRKMYCACDLYVVGSRHEGGPQALLEAPATMTPIVTTDMGIARQVITDNCIINPSQNLYIPTETDVEHNYRNVLKYNIEEQGEKYMKLFKKVISND